MKHFTLLMALAVVFSFSANAQIGLYTFSNPDNLWENSGTDESVGTVMLEGVFKYLYDDVNDASTDQPSVETEDWNVVDGISDKAIAMKAHNWLKIWHGIAANGGSDEWVNDFTIMVDFRVAYDTAIYSLFEVNPEPSTSGYTSEMEIADMKIGSVGAPASGEDPLGFSEMTLSTDTWYRAVYVAKLSEYVKVYVDGTLAVETLGDFSNARPAPYSADFYPDDAALRIGGNNETIENNDPPRDGDKEIDAVAVWGRDLSAEEVEALGGPGNFTSIARRAATPDNFFSIYPNPASDVVYLRGTDLAQVEIIGISGQVVQRTILDGQNSLDISRLDRGMYLVKGYDRSGASAIRKLIVE